MYTNSHQVPVCIIDGDAAVRDSLGSHLMLWGHEVALFETGTDFLTEAQQRLVECVICEAELPDTTGVELFRTLQRAQPDVRFALLVSHSDPALIINARGCGIRAVFCKPLVHRRVLAFVQRPGSLGFGG